MVLPDLPVRAGSTEQQLFVIRSYLCELSDRLQLALWNIGEEALSPALQEKLSRMAQDAKEAGDRITRQEAQAQKEFRDLMNRLVETAQEVTLSFETSLREQEDRITASAIAKELGILEETLSSNVTQTASDLTASFQQIAAITAQEAVEKQAINAYFRFSPDGLMIGRSVQTLVDGEWVETMPFATCLQSDRLSFLDGGAEVAYISHSQLYITQAQVTGTMTYGYAPLGRYAMQVRPGGNFGLSWSREEEAGE